MLSVVYCSQQVGCSFQSPCIRLETNETKRLIISRQPSGSHPAAIRQPSSSHLRLRSTTYPHILHYYLDAAWMLMGCQFPGMDSMSNSSWIWSYFESIWMMVERCWDMSSWKRLGHHFWLLLPYYFSTTSIPTLPLLLRYCLNTTSILLQYWSFHSTEMLLRCYWDATKMLLRCYLHSDSSILFQYCWDTASILPRYYFNINSSIPLQYYLDTTNVLLKYYLNIDFSILLQYYFNTASILLRYYFNIDSSILLRCN